MPQTNQAIPSNQEGRILLAVQVFKLRQFKSIYATAKSYDVPYRTLYNRIHGMASRCDSTPNSQKLTPTEELAVVRYILDLDSRRFPPRPQAVQEMADLLLAECDMSPVGKNWTSNFIHHCTELKTKFSCKYNFKRVQYKNPEIIGGWFRLVQNTIAKYRITEEDIYNFDKAGFLIEVIATAKVVTSSELRNHPKTAQPGNRE
jgi:hypothetical protein